MKIRLLFESIPRPARDNQGSSVTKEPFVKGVSEGGGYRNNGPESGQTFLAWFIRKKKRVFGPSEEYKGRKMISAGADAKTNVNA